MLEVLPRDDCIGSGEDCSLEEVVEGWRRVLRCCRMQVFSESVGGLGGNLMNYTYAGSLVISWRCRSGCSVWEFRENGQCSKDEAQFDKMKPF